VRPSTLRSRARLDGTVAKGLVPLRCPGRQGQPSKRGGTRMRGCLKTSAVRELRRSAGARRRCGDSTASVALCLMTKGTARAGHARGEVGRWPRDGRWSTCASLTNYSGHTAQLWRWRGTFWKRSTLFPGPTVAATAKAGDFAGGNGGGVDADDGREVAAGVAVGSGQLRLLALEAVHAVQARAAQPAMKARPPSGVMAPSQRVLVRARR
jgi:hypothetical protein